MKICSQCQTENFDGNVNCKNCKFPLNQVKELNLMYCPDCNHQLSPRAENCPNCGRFLQRFETPKEPLDVVIQPTSKSLSAVSKTVIGIAWTGSLFCTAIGALVFLSALSPAEGKTIMQEIGTMCFGIGLAVIPYCFARGLSDVAKLGL